MSNNGHVWGIDHRDKIWYRKGANNQTILGSNWKSISGNLKQVNLRYGTFHQNVLYYFDNFHILLYLLNSHKLKISVGHCGVWGINSEQSVFYRLNSYGDPDNEGTGKQIVFLK